MQLLPPQKKLPPEQRKLLDLYLALEEQNRQSLMAFAEFLTGRGLEEAHFEPEPLQTFKSIPRPESESVVKAIKRLSESYFMLERDQMFSETSSLMMAHVMQGRGAVEVINDLETLFERHYQRYRDGD